MRIGCIWFDRKGLINVFTVKYTSKKYETKENNVLSEESLTEVEEQDYIMKLSNMDVMLGVIYKEVSSVDTFSTLP